MKIKAITLFLFLMLAAAGQVSAQQLFYTHQGVISFFSETPVENIAATNRKVNSVLDKSSGKLSFKLPVNGFEFPNKLMQEHFNENYLETEKYPTSEFRGRIMDYGNVPLDKPGTYQVTVTGDLTLHGVTKEIRERGTLVVNKDGTIDADAKFKIRLEDYQIKIPSIVVTNIAEVVDVTVDLTLEPHQKK